MKAKVGDWIMCKDGAGLRLGVVRYVSESPSGGEDYRCDDFVCPEGDVLEVRVDRLSVGA
jgi:hypothetical protein